MYYRSQFYFIYFRKNLFRAFVWHPPAGEKIGPGHIMEL